MTRLETALANIIGVKPTYMRPPYLATGGNVLSVMKTLGYRVITDDVDAEDWNGKSPAQSQQKFQQAGASGNGHIPLMHETYQGTVETLTPWLINWAKTNNLKLVTVGEFGALHATWILWANETQPNAWVMLEAHMSTQLGTAGRLANGQAQLASSLVLLDGAGARQLLERYKSSKRIEMHPISCGAF